jgi:hypothetical protein
MANNAPTATFHSTSVNYTGDDLTLISAWLGSDGASLVGHSPTNNMDDGLISLTGSYAVTAPGTVDFRIPSDDRSVLKIGGVTVIDNDGSHGTPGNAPNGSATFTAAGLYPVEVSYYNGDWTDPANPAAHGGAAISWRVGPADTSPLVATASLYTIVPEPSSLALFGLGGLALLNRVIRRKK